MSANDSSSNQSRCIDCGNPPKLRGEVTWEDENEVEHTTTCTSSFHVIVKRERGAYEYLSDMFEVLWTTSVPMTDQEAIEYMNYVQEWQAGGKPVCYITARPLNGSKFEMLPWRRDPETGEVTQIARAS